ncbi:hypothetical protein BJV78DRAFT_1177500 [Lactifluus subvellereus]|nr:hypothetical protein BJV78DRAFT_1177500 [Lactifluus subvellereus]
MQLNSSGRGTKPGAAMSQDAGGTGGGMDRAASERQGGVKLETTTTSRLLKKASSESRPQGTCDIRTNRPHKLSHHIR